MAARFQPCFPRALIAAQHLVPRLPCNSIGSAQTPHRAFARFVLREELLASFHYSAHFPRHASFYMPSVNEPICQPCPRSVLSTISPVCTPRSPGTYVPVFPITPLRGSRPNHVHPLLASPFILFVLN